MSEGHPAITVVGSCNEDVTVAVDQLPQPGQTVLGGDALRSPGGKGANQAVAAARLGAAVELVGRIGDDDTGARLRAALDADGVGTGHLRTTSAAPSGLALIAVDAAGENTIVVSPGANALVTAHDVERAFAAAGPATVTLIQFEVPPVAVAAAIRLAPGRVIVNPAPARSLPPELLRQIDVLVPNRTELGVLTDAPPPATLGEVEALASRLDGARVVVVTLGADGALVVAGQQVTHVPAADVTAIDTTGAGDAFCGALADAVARGHGIVDAVRWAVRAAGLATVAWGAQTALPFREEVLDRDQVPHRRSSYRPSRAARNAR